MAITFEIKAAVRWSTSKAGPVVVREFQGTGFLVDSARPRDAFILSPWDTDPLLDKSENQDLIPSIACCMLTFRGQRKP